MSNKDYRHPRHDAIVRLVREGLPDSGVAAELKVDRRAVARIRRMLGMRPVTNSTTTFDKLDRFTTEPDAKGHVAWTGRTSRSGTPIIRHLDTEIPAARVAFERRTGRDAVGMCRSECDDMPYCVADEHVMDDIERRTVRLQLRQLAGLDAPWDVCALAGHSWDEHGRVEPDLTLFCKQCNTERAQRSRAARDSERNA